MTFGTCSGCWIQFSIYSKGDVLQFFSWQLFCMAWAESCCSFPVSKSSFGGAGYSGFLRISEMTFATCSSCWIQFFIYSKGDVRQFFWLLFCMACARILLLLRCLKSLFRARWIQRFFLTLEMTFATCSGCWIRYFIYPKGDVGRFFSLLFPMAWVRILLLFPQFRIPLFRWIAGYSGSLCISEMTFAT